MSGLVNFLRTTLLGGFLVLLPLVVIFEVLSRAYRVARSATAPVANMLPESYGNYAQFPIAISIFVVCGVCFIFGILMRSSIIRGIGIRLEQKLFLRLPGYRALKGIARGLSGSSETGAFKPVLLISPDGYREFAYLIEDYGAEEATVMVPSTPAAMTGSVRIVRREIIEEVDATLTEVASVMGQFGVGAHDLIARKAQCKNAKQEDNSTQV